ncbi:terminase small subunit [Mycobacterium phage NoShow]|nr:terminase small subunit [Mycobacterium phage NoShow]
MAVAPGPPPKDMGTTARRNPPKTPFRVVGLPESPAPELPEAFRLTDYDEDGAPVRRKVKYPPETRRWWDSWVNSPLNDGFTEHDWNYLLEVAIIHACFFLDIDRMKCAAELRQRMANFGATPADRAKLRIITVTADTAEETAEEAKRLNAQVGVVGEGRRLTAIPGFAS